MCALLGICVALFGMFLVLSILLWREHNNSGSCACGIVESWRGPGRLCKPCLFLVPCGAQVRGGLVSHLPGCKPGIMRSGLRNFVASSTWDCGHRCNTFLDIWPRVGVFFLFLFFNPKFSLHSFSKIATHLSYSWEGHIVSAILVSNKAICPTGHFDISVWWCVADKFRKQKALSLVCIHLRRRTYPLQCQSFCNNTTVFLQ